MRTEFRRQVENLLQKGYAEAAGVGRNAFLGNLEPLAARLDELGALRDAGADGHVPFVLVLKHDVMPRDKAMALVERRGKRGFTSMEAGDLAGFEPIEDLLVPQGLAYLLLDVDLGTATLNVTPNEALQTIKQAGRSPLTTDEGIALVTQFPEALQRNKCFYMLGSRRDDRRVTAIWLSENKPRLGWCWAGNPHTWLGSASCGDRVGA